MHDNDKGALVGRMTIGEAMPVDRQLAVLRQDLAALRAQTDELVPKILEIVDIVLGCGEVEQKAADLLRELVAELAPNNGAGLAVIKGGRG